MHIIIIKTTYFATITHAIHKLTYLLFVNNYFIHIRTFFTIKISSYHRQTLQSFHQVGRKKLKFHVNPKVISVHLCNTETPEYAL